MIPSIVRENILIGTAFLLLPVLGWSLGYALVFRFAVATAHFSWFHLLAPLTAQLTYALLCRISERNGWNMFLEPFIVSFAAIFCAGVTYSLPGGEGLTPGLATCAALGLSYWLFVAKDTTSMN